MRGGRGYYSRGSGNRRGGTSYRSSNSYGDRNSNNRIGGRYDANYSGGGGSNRYHSSNYESRNRDNFSSGRRDMDTKRGYPDSSRDRSGDRKHSRSDDYRRTSLGHSNRTPPPPLPPPIGSSSDSRNYRGSNSGVNSYRNGGERSHSSTRRNRSPPPKRPLRTGGMLSRSRGVMSSSSRGIRSSLRGTLRSHGIRRESVDLKIMRRKLFYAQQKDRQRVMKIARLTSTLRRRQLARRSKSPRRSRSGKKSSDSEDDDDDDENKDKNGDDNNKDADENDDNNENGSDKSDADETSDKKKKSSSGKIAVKRSGKSTEKEGEDNNDDDENNETEPGSSKSKTASNNKNIGDNDEEEDAENKANKSKQDEGDSSADVDLDKNIDKAEDGTTTTNKVASKSTEGGSTDKKDGKKNEKESSRKDKDKGKDKDKSKDKEKSSKKSSTKKDDKKRKEDSGSKDEKRDKDKKSSTTIRSFSRRDDHSSNMRSNSRFIKLTCVHCNMKCVTFKDYSQHLHLPRHKNAIRQVAMRQRAYLMRLRLTQRTAQREIEEKSKEEYEPKFCHLCRLNYRQPKAKHQLSEHHKTIKKFLMPYCSTCHLAFKSPMLYETHRCSLDHIRNKARKNDSDSDNSGDDMREIDLNKYTTVDSVGEIDDDLGVGADDIDMDGTLDESQNDGEEDEAGNRLPVGAKFIKKMDCFFCSLCNSYTPVSGTPMRSFLKKHCLLRAHLKAFLAHKGAEEAAKKKNAEEQIGDGEGADDDASALKVEKDDSNEKSEIEENGNNTVADDIDMTADVLDEELWNDVDKDLGDLLAEVEPNSNADGEEDEDESVLNIDIESEKSKAKEMNGKKEAAAAAVVVASTPAESKNDVPKSTPGKPKLQRKAAAAANNKLSDSKDKIAAK